MTSPLDTINRKADDFSKLSGFTAKYRQKPGDGLEIVIQVYSQEIAARLKALFDSLDAVAAIIPEVQDFGGGTFRYTVWRYLVCVPYHKFSGDMLLKFGRHKNYLHDLSMMASTLRDQHYSFINTAANLAAGIRDF